jgi:hypothetical protein
MDDLLIVQIPKAICNIETLVIIYYSHILQQTFIWLTKGTQSMSEMLVKNCTTLPIVIHGDTKQSLGMVLSG